MAIHHLQGATGVYSVTGGPAAMQVPYRFLQADGGTYNVTGDAAALIHAGKTPLMIAGWIAGSALKASSGGSKIATDKSGTGLKVDAAGSSASVVKTSAQLKGDKTQ